MPLQDTLLCTLWLCCVESAWHHMMFWCMMFRLYEWIWAPPVLFYEHYTITVEQSNCCSSDTLNFLQQRATCTRQCKSFIRIVGITSLHPLTVHRLFAGPGRWGHEKRWRGGGNQSSAHATYPLPLPPKCISRVGPGWCYHPHDIWTRQPIGQPSDVCHAIHTFIFPCLPQHGQPVVQSAYP